LIVSPFDVEKRFLLVFLSVNAVFAMATNNTLSLCVDPKYVFQSFNNLGNCYNAFADTLGSNFTNVVETCLNDYCNNPYPDLGGCGKWHGTASLPFVVNTIKGNQSFWNNATCAGVSEAVNTDIGGPGVRYSNYTQTKHLC
jgi:hypothetical protein